MNKQYFHFTLGPVQGFVSQARRTRDFWAGSFILSWLSAVAMRAVQAQNGTILFPAADENFLNWIEGNQTGKKPTQGSVPNRFKAEVSDDFQPEQVIESLNLAWASLATLIYNGDILAVENEDTAEIWPRQINHFWETSWAISSNASDSSVLDQRKNWRSYSPPDEPGVKCMMMDGWQELSGTASPNSSSLSFFWNGLIDNGANGIKTDLRKGESLCAMAYVKRRFTRYFEQLKQPMPNGWTLTGWELPSGVPSIAYMAAVPWLEQALNDASTESLTDFHDAASALSAGYGEWDTQIECIQNAKGEKKWKALDGNIFFTAALENSTLYPDQAQAKQVIQTLKAINKSAELEPVSPFYAVLLMDGDSLGMHMSDTDSQDNITKSLENFTSNVPAEVQQHNGFLIYAGGDDVLAILPLEHALPCAVSLRTLYMKSFEGAGIPTTLSGAIEYAHIKTPLTKILHDAHQLLDDIAKDGSGRDAIACRTWKPGGLQLEWSQPWKVALDDQTGKTVLEELITDFQENRDKDEQFSSKFFYKIRETFTLLSPADEKTDPVLNHEQAIALMTMEYLNSWSSNKDKDPEDAKALVSKLMKQCRPIKRIREKTGVEKDHSQWEEQAKLNPAGALLVRFLAHKGVIAR